ncbi:MAG TPA: histidine phosphatase family protein [Caulobacteraceae bacterium]|nr:histidine phosphatase family protein [Caulobacteraceae bacterium]
MRRQVLLVRHCQSQANSEGRIEGRGDSPLSAEGRSQAEAVAAYIAALGLDDVRLVASSQTRAIETARAIGAACGWEHIEDHRIREGELGWMEDLPYSEVGRHMAERGVTELDATLHGGESLAVVGERFWAAVDHALAEHPGPLVMVSHGYAIQALLRRLDPDVALPRFIGNGDVVEVWLEDGRLAGPPIHAPLKR